MADGCKKEIRLKGIGVSPGVAIGPAFVLAEETIRVPQRTIRPEEVLGEIRRFEEALIETRKQIRQIQDALRRQTQSQDASILDAHLMVLDDRTFIEEVVANVREKHKNIEWVVYRASEKYAAILDAVQDDYLRERVADVKDVARRIIRNLMGGDSPRTSFPDNHIIVTNDLAPSETASLSKDTIIGFATNLGSPTSHTAVMARALELPAVVGLHDITKRVTTGDKLLLDGNKGVLIINPSAQSQDEYGKLIEARRTIEDGLSSILHEPAQTKDGHQVVLSANAEGPEDVDSILKHGADGIGLLRSEFLYMTSDHIMSEDEQSRIYSLIAERLAPSKVIIRTLDLGGDKFIPGQRVRKEDNPFLGLRSIRVSLQSPEFFKQQLKAILRASRFGNVRVMYPMVSNVSEVLAANRLLEESKDELDAAGVEFDRNIGVGAMIEIPAAALTADIIAEHVDFVSIGTNDLIQYTIAIDRGNEMVAYLYQPTHPAVLKLIKMTIDAAHSKGIWVGLCGQMAADPLMTALLLGLGIDELSVIPRSVPLVKDTIRNLELSQAQELAEKSLKCTMAEDVLQLCRDLTREVAPEIFKLI